MTTNSKPQDDNGIQRTLGRIEGQLTGIETALRGFRVELASMRKNQSELEKQAAKNGGIAGVVVSVVVVLIAGLVTYITKG